MMTSEIRLMPKETLNSCTIAVGFFLDDLHNEIITS